MSKNKCDRLLARLIEALTILLVCLSPWLLAFAGTTWRLFFTGGLALLLALWGCRFLLQGQITWRNCPITACLALWFLVGTGQLMAFSPELLKTLAPGTARFYEHVLPAEQEICADGSRAEIKPRLTLSLDAQATRGWVLEILAIVLLFAVVRNNVPAGPGLKRLSQALAFNGTLLSLFVLLRFFIPEFAGAGGEQEHFTLYLVMCVGLALGLLMDRFRVAEAHSSLGLFRWERMLVGCGLLLMICALAFGQSTSALVAVGIAAFFAWLLLLFVNGRMRTFIMGSFVALIAISGWLWAERVSWSQILAQAQDFPLWGTGIGTFAQVALNHSFQIEPIKEMWTPSFIQVLIVEAGTVGLLLLLIIAAMIGRRGYRAFKANQNNGLSFGALFALTSLGVYCFLSGQLFGAPVAILTTVVGGYLAALAEPSGKTSQTHVDLFSIRLMGTAAPAGLLVSLLMGAILVLGGRRADAIEENAQAAAQLRGSGDLDSRLRRLQFLRAAVQEAPGDSYYRLEVAQAHVQLLDKKLENLQKLTRVTEPALASYALTSGASVEFDHASRILAWWLPMNWQKIERDKAEYFEKLHTQAAILQWLNARNASSLNPESQLRLAAAVPQLKKSGSAEIYRERAKWIAPGDPWVYYQCGLQEAEEGEYERALASWHQSLELSDAYLTQILDLSRDEISAEGLLQQILAERPQQLMEAAVYLYPDPISDKKQRQPFMEKTLDLLQKKPKWTGADHYLAATAYSNLGHFSKTRAEFEAALVMEPQNVVWRYGFARFLYQYDSLQEAQKQLATILERQPGHIRANDLLRKVKDRLTN